MHADERPLRNPDRPRARRRHRRLAMSPRFISFRKTGLPGPSSPCERTEWFPEWSSRPAFSQRSIPELDVEILIPDGSRVSEGALLIRVEGKARSILTAERTALNFLQRLSGVATLTAKYVDLIKGTTASILDTRKTTPGYRLLEKQAVVHGGGVNHRLGPLRPRHGQGQPPRRRRRTGGDPSRHHPPCAEKPGVEVELEADNLEQVRMPSSPWTASITSCSTT